MSVIWYKIWYDLWHNKLRTILVVLSIAMGVFAVGTTFGLVEQMVPQMDQAHHSTNPSHGTMFLLQPVDLETISVIERTKEIGVMRAIGAQSHIIMGMFVLEGLFQGILSWLIAVPLAYLITPMLSTAMGLAMFQSALDYRFNFQAVFIWLAALLVISALSAVLPARNATRINVRQCLFYE